MNSSREGIVANSSAPSSPLARKGTASPSAAGVFGAKGRGSGGAGSPLSPAGAAAAPGATNNNNRINTTLAADGRQHQQKNHHQLRPHPPGPPAAQRSTTSPLRHAQPHYQQPRGGGGGRSPRGNSPTQHLSNRSASSGSMGGPNGFGSFTTSPRVRREKREAALRERRVKALREARDRREAGEACEEGDDIDADLSYTNAAAGGGSGSDEEEDPLSLGGTGQYASSHGSDGPSSDEDADSNDSSFRNDFASSGGTNRRTRRRRSPHHSSSAAVAPNGRRQMTRTEAMEAKVSAPVRAPPAAQSKDKADAEALTLIDARRVMHISGTVFDEGSIKLVPNMTTEQLMAIVLLKRKTKNAALMQRARRIKRAMMLLVMAAHASALALLQQRVAQARAESTLGRLLRPIFLRQRLQRARLRRRHRECPDLPRPTAGHMAAAVPLFAELSAFGGLVDRLIEAMDPTTFDSGEHIIRQGECGSTLYFVATGLCVERANVRIRGAGAGSSGGNSLSGSVLRPPALLSQQPLAPTATPAGLVADDDSASSPSAPDGACRGTAAVPASSDESGKAPPLLGGIDMPLDGEDPFSLRFNAMPSSTSLATGGLAPLRRVIVGADGTVSIADEGEAAASVPPTAVLPPPPSAPLTAAPSDTPFAAFPHAFSVSGIGASDGASEGRREDSTSTSAAAAYFDTSMRSFNDTVRLAKIERDAEGRIVSVDDRKLITQPSLSSSHARSPAASSLPPPRVVEDAATASALALLPPSAIAAAVTAASNQQQFLGQVYASGAVFGDVFGVPIPHTCSVVAVSPTVVCWRLTKDSFDRVMGMGAHAAAAASSHNSLHPPPPAAARRIVERAFLKYSLVSLPIVYPVHRSVTAMNKIPLFSGIADRLTLRGRFVSSEADGDLNNNAPTATPSAPALMPPPLFGGGGGMPSSSSPPTRSAQNVGGGGSPSEANGPLYRRDRLRSIADYQLNTLELMKMRGNESPANGSGSLSGSCFAAAIAAPSGTSPPGGAYRHAPISPSLPPSRGAPRGASSSPSTAALAPPTSGGNNNSSPFAPFASSSAFPPPRPPLQKGREGRQPREGGRWS